MDAPSFLFFRGRAALAAILRSLHLAAGDEVITQAFTCVAVPEGIIAAGGTPVYADVRPESVNIDPSDVAKKLSSRTKAIVVQHTFGYAAAIDEITALVADKDILIVEDCCHTLATTIGTRRVGSIGDAAFYSFEWGKPLACGVGGAAQSRHADIANSLDAQQSALHEVGYLRRLRLELQFLGFSIAYRPRTYWAVKRLFNFLSRAGAAEGNFTGAEFTNPSEDFSLAISPAVSRRVRRQFADTAKLAAHAESVVSHYRSMQLCRGVARVWDENRDGSILVRYPLWADEKPALLQRAKKLGIELADWYRTPIHPLAANEQPMVNYTPGSCPQAEVACRKVVSLPTNRHVKSRYLRRTEELFCA